MRELKTFTPCCRVPAISPVRTVSHCTTCWPSTCAGTWGAAFPGALRSHMARRNQFPFMTRNLFVFPHGGRPDSDQCCRERFDLSQTGLLYIETDSSTGMYDSCSHIFHDRLALEPHAAPSWETEHNDGLFIRPWPLINSLAPSVNELGLPHEKTECFLK